MHICFISTQYPPETNYGGIATYVQTASRALVQRGHSISVVSVSHNHQPGQKVVEGITVWRLPEKYSRQTIKEDLYHNWQVWRAVQELKPDIIQMVDYQAEGFLLTQLIKSKIGLVTRLADAITLTKVRREYGFQIRQEILSYMARQQVLHSHAVFSPSVRLARQVEKDSRLKPGLIQHIFNGISLREMANYRQAEPCLAINSPYIIFFGRLEERKGIQYLAQALPTVLEQFPSLKIVFAGQYDSYSPEGKPIRTYIEDLAGKKFLSNLIFTGHLDREKVLPIVARAKLAVLPSVWEPFGFTCAEAIALDVPVIATGDSGGLAEIVAGIDDSEVEPDSVPAGWLVPRRNPHALAATITEALTDGEAMRIVKQNLKKRALRFDVECMVDKLEALYQRVYQK